MAKKDGLLLMALWLLAMPFAFAAPDIYDFKKITPAVQLKKDGKLTYHLFTHKDFSLQLLVNNGDCNEYTCPAVMRFAYGGKPIGSWFGPGVNDAEKELMIYYSESANAYYIIDDVEADDAEAFELYFVTAGNVTYEGLYLPVNDPSQRYLSGAVTAPVITIARKGNAAKLSYANSAGETVLQFSRLAKEDGALLEDSFKQLKAKASAFDWQKGFTPTLKYTLNIDLNANGHREKYFIDWGKKTITGGNADAGSVITAKEIRFEGQTLFLSRSAYWRNDIDTYTYYFSLSKKYNTACLDKYTHFVYRSPVEGDAEAPCNFTEEYYPGQPEPATLEGFALNDEDTETFCHDCYVRRFTLGSLNRILSEKEKSNTLFYGCTPAPTASEIEVLLNTQPLTAANVQQYNDLAYYMLEYPSNDDERQTLLVSSVFLLEQITAAFPGRVVAWLNLADAYWDSQVLKDKAPNAYRRYLELMKSQGKDMAKVPARVRERI